ncbi:MAG TPA: hypothetical protein VGG28_24560 [Kofleriaceae bacterium]|jgi:hypothetical protein
MRVLAAIVLVACGSTAPTPAPVANTAPPPSTDAFEAHLAAFTAFKDALCACGLNAACVNHVTSQLAAWKVDEPDNVAPRTDADRTRYDAVDHAFDTCLHAFEETQPPDGSL